MHTYLSVSVCCDSTSKITTATTTTNYNSIMATASAVNAPSEKRQSPFGYSHCICECYTETQPQMKPENWGKKQTKEMPSANCEGPLEETGEGLNRCKRGRQGVGKNKVVAGIIHIAKYIGTHRQAQLRARHDVSIWRSGHLHDVYAYYRLITFNIANCTLYLRLLNAC